MRPAPMAGVLLAIAVSPLVQAAVPQAPSGPCPVLPYRPGHVPQGVAPAPRAPQQPAAHGSELEIQRRCNAWLSSFRPAVDFAPQLSVAREPRTVTTPPKPSSPEPGGSPFGSLAWPVPQLEARPLR